MSPPLEQLERFIKDKNDILIENQFPFQGDRPITDEFERVIRIINTAIEKDVYLIERNNLSKKLRVEDLEKQIVSAKQSLVQLVYANEADQKQINADINNYQTQIDTIDLQTDIVKPRTIHFELLYAADLMRQAIQSRKELDEFIKEIESLMDSLRSFKMSFSTASEMPSYINLLNLNTKLQQKITMTKSVDFSEEQEMNVTQAILNSGDQEDKNGTAQPIPELAITPAVVPLDLAINTSEKNPEQKELKSRFIKLKNADINQQDNINTEAVITPDSKFVTNTASAANKPSSSLIASQHAIKAVVQGAVTLTPVTAQSATSANLNTDQQCKTFESLFRESVKDIADYEVESVVNNTNDITIEHLHNTDRLPSMVIIPDGTIRSSVPTGENAEAKMHVLAEALVAAHLAHLAVSGEKMTCLPLIKCANGDMETILNKLLQAALTRNEEPEEAPPSFSLSDS